MAGSSLSALRDNAGLEKPAQAPQDRFVSILNSDSFRAQVQAALPRHLNADRMVRICMTEMRKNPKLGECSPQSVLASIMVASQLGLETGPMGQAYLIPFSVSTKVGDKWEKRMECQLQIGYQGLLDLVYRSGRVRTIEAKVVHANDEFSYVIGRTPPLRHTPELFNEPGAPRLAYAIATFANGGQHVEVMTSREIEGIKNRSQAVVAAKKFGKQTPWDTDTEEMWRKTIIKRICKYIPKSVEMSNAVMLDNAAETGAQALTMDDAKVLAANQPLELPEAVTVPTEELPADGHYDFTENREAETV